MSASALAPAAHSVRWGRGVLVLLLVLLGAAIVRLAWLGDDAFITFRCVENFVAGRGPVWNADERVQAFTHPLWFGVLVLLRLVTGELPLSTMWLGALLSVGAAAWLARLQPNAWAGAVVVACLLASRGFCDYATSGLENPLSFVLLAALLAVARRDDPVRRLRGVTLVTGLLALVRLDLLVLGAPVCLAALRGVSRGAALRAVVRGALPLALWSAFAAIYYGSPFPITAHAKAFGHGLPAGALFANGVHFLAAHVRFDPGTVAVIVLGAAAGFATRGRRALALGMLLYLGYVVRVGGDFMLGRFLTPLVFVGAALLAEGAARRGRWWLGIAAGLVVAAAVAGGVPGYLRSIRSDLDAALQVRDDGLADERRYYWWGTGLWSPARGHVPLEAGFHSARMRANGDTARRFEVVSMVGMFAYVNGDLVHVVDECLLDPFLMRLPIGDPNDWRPGHYFRRIPVGYLESLASGENRIADPRAAKLWDVVRSVTRDPVFAAERWRNLWTLWTGGLRDEIDAYVVERYRTPSWLEVPFAELATPVQPGVPWYRHPAARTCEGGGVAVRLPAAADAAAVTLQLTGVADYRIELCRAGHVVHAEPARVELPPGEGFVPVTVAVPPAAGAIDELRVRCTSGVSWPVAAFLGSVATTARR